MIPPFARAPRRGRRNCCRIQIPSRKAAGRLTEPFVANSDFREACSETVQQFGNEPQKLPRSKNSLSSFVMGLHGFVGPQFGPQRRPDRSIVNFHLPEGVIHAAFFTIQRHMKLSLWGWAALAHRRCHAADVRERQHTEMQSTSRSR